MHLYANKDVLTHLIVAELLPTPFPSGLDFSTIRVDTALIEYFVSYEQLHWCALHRISLRKDFSTETDEAT